MEKKDEQIIQLGVNSINRLTEVLNNSMLLMSNWSRLAFNLDQNLSNYTAFIRTLNRNNQIRTQEQVTRLINFIKDRTGYSTELIERVLQSMDLFFQEGLNFE